MHYDGDILLFTTYANGQLADVRPELLATYYPAAAAGGTPSLAVLDRDFSELNVTSHSASGYSGLNYGSGPFHNGKVTITQTVYEPASDGTPPYFDNGQPEPSLQYTHPDGFSTPLGRIQGVRAMDTDLGTWKSPDAYAGDVHDPLSQKPYMWNRNNPYEYSDPSGFFVEDSAAAGEEALETAYGRGGNRRRNGPLHPPAHMDPGGWLNGAKDALRAVWEKLQTGSLPKAPDTGNGKGIGRKGSPTRGDANKGYRLDPGHPGQPPESPESGPHINYWDYTHGKRNKGGIKGAIPINPPEHK